MYPCLLTLPKKSFFPFGPRGTGKSVRFFFLTLLSLSLIGCNTSKSNDDDKTKKEELRKNCALLETVHSSFQAYMTCIETNSSEIRIGSNIDFVKKEGESIKNACAETLNYEIPEKLNSKMLYFFKLQKKMKIPPIQDDLESRIAALFTFPFIGLELAFATDEEEKTCFDNKVSSYSASLKIDYYESLTPKEKKDLDNQLEAALKIFLKECRREVGGKAYQDSKQRLKCDSMDSATES